MHDFLLCDRNVLKNPSCFGVLEGGKLDFWVGVGYYINKGATAGKCNRETGAENALAHKDDYREQNNV